MARELPYIAAINEAIHLEMERDDSVLFFGQNMATTENEPFVDAFGRDRVRVTPISETAEIGIAVGAALAGYRPVVELYMAEFMLVAMDQVTNEAPRFRYMSAGQVKVPLVLKAGYGFTAGWAGQHTGTIYAMFMGVPGLTLAGEGIEAEAIDPRTLAPLDTARILESVEKTGRLVLADQATRHGSASAVIAAEVADRGFSSLKAPIKQVTALDATIAYSAPLEAAVLPDEAKVVGAVRQVLGSPAVAV